MTNNFDPPLKGNKGEIRPQNREETVDEKYCQPAILSQHHRKIYLAPVQHVSSGGDQAEKHQRVDRAAFLERDRPGRDSKISQPLRYVTRTDDQHPKQRYPQRPRYVRIFREVPPKQENDEANRQKQSKNR